MNYQHYTSSDFALDQNFRQWVLKPTEESSQFWNDWINTHPGKKEEIAEAIKLIRAAGLLADTEINTAFLEVWQHVGENALQSENTRKRKVAMYYTRMAAIWIGFVLLASYVFWKVNQPAVAVTYATGFGEIKKVVLADGSRITLNANSSIRLFDEGWAKAPLREVFLEGEAFFEITRTKDKKKFIVKTADSVTVQVLGTEFNVNTRRKKTAVYLQSGKVQLNATTGQLMMKPGDFVRYTNKEKRLNVARIKEETQLAWRNNLFVFDDTTLLDIAQELEDTYGIKVIITGDSLARQRFTAKMSRNKVNVLLKVLAETLQIDITRQNNEVRIQPKQVPVNEKARAGRS